MTASRLRRIGIYASVAALLVWFFLRPTFFDDQTRNELCDILISRGLCCITFLLTLIERNSPLIPPFCRDVRQKHPLSIGKMLLFCLPWLLVCLNNAPLLPLAMGDMTLTLEPISFLIYIAGTLGIAFFEEAAFRGIVFPYLLGKIGKTPWRLFLSILATSAVFGVMHLVNLFEGASPLSVLMQVGYSFLIGSMCTLALLKTGGLVMPTLLHFLFNLGGYLYDRFGQGALWTMENIILTAALAACVTAYSVWVLTRVTPEEVEIIRNS